MSCQETASTADAGVPRVWCDQSAMCRIADVSLLQHRGLYLHWTLNKRAFLRIITHQYDLESAEQLRYVGGCQHKLVEEVRSL